jgi:putative IMPACT (imprinted ancient) family translation regulator
MAATDLVEAVIPYPFFERTRLLISELDGVVIDEAFGIDVTVTVRLESERTEDYLHRLEDLTHGAAVAEIRTHHPDTILPIKT